MFKFNILLVSLPRSLVIYQFEPALENKVHISAHLCVILYIFNEIKETKKSIFLFCMHKVRFWSVRKVTAVATQGRKAPKQWVESYSLSYGNLGGDAFTNYGNGEVKTK